MIWYVRKDSFQSADPISTPSPNQPPFAFKTSPIHLIWRIEAWICSTVSWWWIESDGSSISIRAWSSEQRPHSIDESKYADFQQAFLGQPLEHSCQAYLVVSLISSFAFRSQPFFEKVTFILERLFQVNGRPKMLNLQFLMADRYYFDRSF